MSFPRLADYSAHPTSRKSLLLRFVVCALLASVAVAVMPAALAAPAPTPVPTPRLPVPAVPAGLPVAIEPFAQYVPQTSCDPVTKPGTLRLAQLLAATYAGTTFNTVYACGTDGSISEHYDGRAIDWMVSARNPTQYQQATAFLNWLFAKDATGNADAMLRRLGIMYIVWDNRIWGSWNQRWDPYNGCASTPQTSYDNACHRTHIHLSLSWEGARALTSFWSHTVATTDWGPCAPAGVNWATPWTAPNPSGCAEHRTVSAPSGGSPLLQQLYRYSGQRLSLGMSGPGVTAVQQAVAATPTGTFDAVTRSAVIAFQQGVLLPGSGIVDLPTWLALLQSMDPLTRQPLHRGPPLNGQ